MNSTEGEYKIVLGESFKNEKNTILFEDLKTLSLYDNKTDKINDFNNANIYLDNINKQIKETTSKYSYKENKDDYSYILIKNDDYYVIERISNRYCNYNEIKDIKKFNENEEKDENTFYGDDSESDPDNDEADAFYS